ncbi:MAG: sulfide/dihydroorotate dehydrogenase-like FAD/NAD-binding protein [Thermodesulfobacteriota bacterium]
MYEIVEKRVLAPNISLFKVKAPRIALKRKPGNFVVVRIDERGERIPLTIAGADIKEGTITIVTQEVGRTTKQMVAMEPGDAFQDVVGPLGKATHIENYGTAVTVSGGYGVAAVVPIAEAFKAAGSYVISIIGARNKELVILEEDIQAVSHEVHISTNDGSYGQKGLVTDVLKHIIEGERKVGFVIAVGPTPMMRAVSELTRPYAIKTMVSLNSIMVDGTGMCGSCRVTVGGQSRFVCVDGPEFDGHEVDFDEMVKRQKMYLDEEKRALEEYLHG